MAEFYENEEVMVEEIDGNEGGIDKGLLIGAGAIAAGAILAEHGVKKGIDLGKKFIGKVKEEKAKRANKDGKLEEVEVVEGEPVETSEK